MDFAEYLNLKELNFRLSNQLVENKELSKRKAIEYEEIIMSKVNEIADLKLKLQSEEHNRLNEIGFKNEALDRVRRLEKEQIVKLNEQDFEIKRKQNEIACLMTIIENKEKKEAEYENSLKERNLKITISTIEIDDLKRKLKELENTISLKDEKIDKMFQNFIKKEQEMTESLIRAELQCQDLINKLSDKSISNNIYIRELEMQLKSNQNNLKVANLKLDFALNEMLRFKNERGKLIFEKCKLIQPVCNRPLYDSIVVNKRDQADFESLIYGLTMKELNKNQKLALEQQGEFMRDKLLRLQNEKNNINFNFNQGAYFINY